MADWTTIRWNLRYHWVTVVLWLLGIGAGFVFALWAGRADAWTRAVTQLFPDGEAPIVVSRFCLGRGCELRETYSQAVWQREIRAAMAKWNAAGAAFTFTERSERSTDNPCNTIGAVVIISYESGVGCPSDQRVFDDAKRRGIAWDGLTIYWPDTPRIYVKGLSPIARLRWNLLHELGHIVGLGHPDGAGQNVAAVMNLRSTYDDLQPDDIAGIRALYGTRMVEEEPTTPTVSAGYLESPAQNTVLSGIGFVSGWKCDAQNITVRIDGGQALDMSMGVLREDTRSACDGEAENGFITQVNWNNYGAGTHTAVAYDNDVEFARSTFTVGTTGEEFLRGVVVDTDVPDFPTSGRTSRFVWNESTQHLELAEVYPNEEEPTVPPSTTAVSRFNGVWEFSSAQFIMKCSIAQGVVSCNRDWRLGTISPSGDLTMQVSSRYFHGRLGENTGRGTWIYGGEATEDGRDWTAIKQSSLASITSPVCGVLRGLRVEDYDDNFGRWTITNPCASWNGHTNVLHIDIVPLSPDGFDMDTGDMLIVQGDRRVTYDEDNSDITQALFWADPQTQEVSTREVLPYRLTEEPYRISVIAGRNTGLNFRQPFALYYDDKLVAIFE